MNTVNEVNFDGLVGPTHHYGGLASGNLASKKHAFSTSSPKKAALQGLEKMWRLKQMGFHQGFFLPHERPAIRALKTLGFTGNTDAAIVADAYKKAPELLSQFSSASAMWVANAATVSPFYDTSDGKTHITPANLISHAHRAIESTTTAEMLKRIFATDDFVHHPALRDHSDFADEGAANHTRFCADYGERGVAFFVYGRCESHNFTKRFSARQTKAASCAIANQHGLASEKVVMAQQHPDAIDAGVFHNDVIAVGDRRTLFYHQQAFMNTNQVLADLQSALGATELEAIEVSNEVVSLQDAVAAYLFNSQLLSHPESRKRILIAPEECQQIASVNSYLRQALHQKLFDEIQFFDLKQSMSNGGGPACLRFRMVLSATQQQQLGAQVLLTEHQYQHLQRCINQYYPEQLSVEQLQDPQLLMQMYQALDELTQITGIGSIYDFQR